MNASLTLIVPAGWRRIESGLNQEASIAEAVDAAYRNADRDSSAVAKHWMRERLREALTSPPDVDSEVVAVAYPERPAAGMMLPVSVTVLKLKIKTDSVEEAMKALAMMAAREPDAKPIETPVGLVLRSHSVRDIKEAFDAEVEGAPIKDDEKTAIAAASDAIPSLRARYIVPSGSGDAWHAVAFTAMLGADEPELPGVYLELFDAFVRTMEWRASS